MKPFPGILGGQITHKPGSIGILLPGMEAKLLREDGITPCDINEPGELHLKSGCIALGYWKNKEETKKTFADGWLKTGDRLRVDKEGLY